jgi:hypothetical protein
VTIHQCNRIFFGKSKCIDPGEYPENRNVPSLFEYLYASIEQTEITPKLVDNQAANECTIFWR